MSGGFSEARWYYRIDLPERGSITPYRDGDALYPPLDVNGTRDQQRLLKRIENDKCEIERLTAACKQWEAKAYAKNAACAEAAILLDRAVDALKKAHAA